MVIVKIMIITVLVLLYIMIGILIDATVVYLVFKDAHGPVVWLFWPIAIITIPLMFLMAGFYIVGNFIVLWIQKKIFK